jgi:hypothetical protein
MDSPEGIRVKPENSFSEYFYTLFSNFHIACFSQHTANFWIYSIYIFLFFLLQMYMLLYITNVEKIETGSRRKLTHWQKCSSEQQWELLYRWEGIHHRMEECSLILPVQPCYRIKFKTFPFCRFHIETRFLVSQKSLCVLEQSRQLCFLDIYLYTCHGYWFGWAFTPPTILPTLDTPQRQPTIQQFCLQLRRGSDYIWLLIWLC